MISFSGLMPVGGADTLYTCENVAGARIDRFDVVNKSGSQISLNIYIHNTIVGVDRAITAQNQQIPDGAHAYADKPIYLNFQDRIEASISGAGPCHYSVQGYELGKDPET